MPAARTNSPEREIYCPSSPLVFIWEGCKDVTAAAATKEQDRKKDRAKVASHTRTRGRGRDGDVDTFGRWDYSSRCLRRRTTVG